MAQVPPAPWSRWDAPGYQYVSNQTDLSLIIQNDSDSLASNPATLANATSRGTATLIRQYPNPNNADFVQCVYGVDKSTNYIIEQCSKTYGCCPTSCCISRRWEEEYAWALALIIFFCLLVLVALGLTLFCWLYNRAKDKRQKVQLIESIGELSPAQSQIDPSINQLHSESGYYPYVGGPNQY